MCKVVSDEGPTPLYFDGAAIRAAIKPIETVLSWVRDGFDECTNRSCE
jgi:hypothetical protein